MVYCRFPSMVIICNYFYQNKQVKVVLVILSNFIFGKKLQTRVQFACVSQSGKIF